MLTVRRRRWYGFNDLELVKRHISEVKTLGDVQQLQADVANSGCNLVEFLVPRVSGVFTLDCYAGQHTYRHVFMTKAAHEKFGGLRPGEGHALTVLED